MIAKVFKSGNSLALRIPKELNPKEGKMNIVKQGNCWIVEPVAEESWPENFFDEIRIDNTDFQRPSQGEHRSIEL